MSRSVTFFTAVKAFIQHDDKILLLRESAAYDDGIHAGLYDIPGGRMTPGEAWDSALHREIKEECGLTVTIGRPFHVDETRIQKAEEWQIVRIFFACAAHDNAVRLGADHDHFAWVPEEDLLSYPLIPNLVPTVNEYLLFKGLV